MGPFAVCVPVFSLFFFFFSGFGFEIKLKGFSFFSQSLPTGAEVTFQKISIRDGERRTHWIQMDFWKERRCWSVGHLISLTHAHAQFPADSVLLPLLLLFWKHSSSFSLYKKKEKKSGCQTETGCDRVANLIFLYLQPHNLMKIAQRRNNKCWNNFCSLRRLTPVASRSQRL